jgi:hypothetical protein
MRVSTFFGSDWVEKGQLLFHGIAPAEWANNTTLFVLPEAQLYCERLQAVVAMEKV